MPALVQSVANSVEFTERGKELECARKEALAVKQLQQALSTGFDEALAHRRWHDRTGVDQQLRARRTGKPSFSLRIAGVAVGARGNSQQAAFTVPVVALPGQQRGVFSQQLLQAFDVVVVNDASSLCCRPLESFAEAFADFSGEVLPAGVAVLAGDHELRVTLRQGQVNVWQLRPGTCDGSGVTGGDLTRQLLGLFTEGLERRTNREGLRSGHGDLLS